MREIVKKISIICSKHKNLREIVKILIRVSALLVAAYTLEVQVAKLSRSEGDFFLTGLFTIPCLIMFGWLFKFAFEDVSWTKKEKIPKSRRPGQRVIH